MTQFLKTTTLLAGGDRIPSTKLNHIDTTIQTTKKKMTIKMSSTLKSQKTSSINRTLKPSKTHHKTTARPKHVVCLNFMGRLGNLMFQYAAAYGIARSKDMDVIISANARISKIFHLDWGARVVKDTSRCKEVPISAEIRASAFNKETMDFKNDEDVAMFGYLQSYKYFEKVSGEVRRQFTFRDSIRNAAEDELSDILEDHLETHGNETHNWTFIAVHVRRGDMVNHPHGYMVAPKWYFQRTQNMFRAFYQSVIFVVCSDDINWCKNNLKSDDTYFVTGNTPEVDMAILSSCNHTISSVGSFSWWSAWLGNGLVTYYFPPARPGSGLRRAYSKDYNDYFPPHWIRVEA